METTALRRLADLVAIQVDVADEHQRWSVYRAAIDGRRDLDAILAAVREEPDGAVARAAIVEALPSVPDERLADWVEADVHHADGFVGRRAAEVRLLRGVLEGRVAPTAGDVDGWSDWLQLGVATGSARDEVLAVLAEAGRTKRIRGTARSRLEASRARARREKS